MMISDILLLIAACAVVFLPLGYAAHNRLSVLRVRLQRQFGAPRYLKAVRKSAHVSAHMEENNEHRH